MLSYDVQYLIDTMAFPDLLSLFVYIPACSSVSLCIVDTYMLRLTTYAKYCAQMFSFLHNSYTYILLLTAQATLLLPESSLYIVVYLQNTIV
jgi:hypothetical protein